MSNAEITPQKPTLSGLNEVHETDTSDSIIAPGFAWPAGVCFLLGGSGFSVGIVNSRGETMGASRSIPWSEIGVVPGHSLSNEAVVEALFNKLFDVSSVLLGTKEGFRVAAIALSFAGPLTGEGDAILAHGTNMNVQFDRPIKQIMHQYAERAGYTDIPLRDLIVINDAGAGALGELYAENGAARDANDLIYLILGTGVGGARAVNGAIDPEFTEAGHTLIQNAAGEFELHTMAELSEMGLFRNGAFVTPSDGRFFLEHRIGGPWVAVRYAKFLKENAIDVFEKFHELERPEGCPDFSHAELAAIAALDEADIANWNRLVDKNVEKAVNMMLRHHSSVSRVISSNDEHQIAFQFENILNSEIGDALKVLAEHYPEAEIVLGSSLAEVRRNNTDFLDMLYVSTNGRAQVSNITSGTERETASLVKHLQDSIGE